MTETTNSENNGDRRKFIVISTIGASAACALFPFATGIPSILDPVTREDGNAKVPWTKVTALATLPEDGTAYLVGWNEEQSTGKMWIATGTVEDFSDASVTDFIT